MLANSLLAYASVNHLHYHFMYTAHPLLPSAAVVNYNRMMYIIVYISYSGKFLRFSRINLQPQKFSLRKFWYNDQLCRHDINFTVSAKIVSANF